MRTREQIEADIAYWTARKADSVKWKITDDEIDAKLAELQAELAGLN